MLTPLRELVGIQRKLFLELGDIGRVFVEENGTIASLETVQSLLRTGPGLGWGNRLDGWLDNLFPEFGVVVTQQNDDACGLRVEG